MIAQETHVPHTSTEHLQTRTSSFAGKDGAGDKAISTRVAIAIHSDWSNFVREVEPASDLSVVVR